MGLTIVDIQVSLLKSSSFLQTCLNDGVLMLLLLCFDSFGFEIIFIFLILRSVLVLDGGDKRSGDGRRTLSSERQ
jgi:hypothetical protein